MTMGGGSRTRRQLLDELADAARTRSRPATNALTPVRTPIKQGCVDGAHHALDRNPRGSRLESRSTPGPAATRAAHTDSNRRAPRVTRATP
jgi:hypothetical protein